MPLTWSGPADPLAWPPGPSAMTHPRTAGTFGRAMRLLTRGDQPLGLAQALSRCSLEPARLLEARVPAMRRKGRLQAGADGDLVVFDPVTLTDRATYSDSTRPSAGIWHVLVNGAFVVRDGSIVPDARPGRPVRAAMNPLGDPRTAAHQAICPFEHILFREFALPNPSLLCSNTDMGVTGEEQVRGAPPTPRRPPEGAGRCARANARPVPDRPVGRQPTGP
jgi:hypothetical protein